MTGQERQGEVVQWMQSYNQKGDMPRYKVELTVILHNFIVPRRVDF